MQEPSELKRCLISEGCSKKVTLPHQVKHRPLLTLQSVAMHAHLQLSLLKLAIS